MKTYGYRPFLCFFPRVKLSHDRSPIGRVIHPTGHNCLDGRAIYQLRQLALMQLVYKQERGAFCESVVALLQANSVPLDYKLDGKYEFDVQWSNGKVSIDAIPLNSERISYVMDWQGMIHYAIDRQVVISDPIAPVERTKKGLRGIRLCLSHSRSEDFTIC